jgi:hypothetical protein
MMETRNSAASVPGAFIFNGDADGILSQHLLELSGVAPSMRLTGLKRDISLLGRLPQLEAARLFVFDISLEVNREELETRLRRPGISVLWFDHHAPGEIPVHPRLETHIHAVPDTCTSLIVQRHLPGSDSRWAAAAAFGDNLPEIAEALLRPLGLPRHEIATLRELGQLINYNAYGETPDDVLFHPLELASRLSDFRDPLVFHRESGIFPGLKEQYLADEAQLEGLRATEEKGRARIFHLPHAVWARRMASVFANRLALSHPDEATAILHGLQDGAYRVSLRAPSRRPGGVPPASDLAREFPTGGGRHQAAGINRLPADQVERFHQRFFETYS